MIRWNTLITNLAILLNIYFVIKLLTSKQKNMFKSYNINISKSPKKKKKVVRKKSSNRIGIHTYLDFVRDLVEMQNFKTQVIENNCMLILAMFYVISWEFSKDFTLLMRIIYTICLANIPCLFLAIRLRKVKAVGSSEGIEFLTFFITTYRVNGDFISTLDKSLVHCESINVLRKPLLRLTLSLKEYRTEEELDELLKKFYKSVGTNWAFTFTSLVYSAVNIGQDQTYALQSLMDDLEYGQKLYQNFKRANSDIVIMVKWVIPLIYAASIFMLIYGLSFSLSDFINAQFMDPTGRKLFIGVILCECMNLLFYYFIENKRIDSIR